MKSPKATPSGAGLRVRIAGAIDDVLAPLLAADGGGIELVTVDETAGEVVLRLTGAFVACPGTPVVRADVIEPLLRARGASSFRYQR